KVLRWARVLLPNGQVIRCRWGEDRSDFTCTGKMIKVCSDHLFRFERQTEFAEAHYFAEVRIQNRTHRIAIGSFFGPPEPYLLEMSSGMYCSMQHLRDSNIRVFSIKSIAAGVMMGP
ncbi:hypothetical protein C8F01DRAFT_942788, partial [Mycena amicta]